MPKLFWEQTRLWMCHGGDIVRIALIAGTMLLYLGMGQLPASAPPMKMGLWEQTTVVNMKMTGKDVPKGMPTTQTMKARVCYTSETWSKALSGSHDSKSCTFSKVSITGSHMSVGVTCNEGMAMKMQIEGDFPTKETGRGTVHMEMNMSGMNMLSDSTYEMHFVSSDCGALAAGKTEIVK
jgi:hypothetical protein